VPEDVLGAWEGFKSTLFDEGRGRDLKVYESCLEKGVASIYAHPDPIRSDREKRKFLGERCASANDFSNPTRAHRTMRMREECIKSLVSLYDPNRSRAMVDYLRNSHLSCSIEPVLKYTQKEIGFDEFERTVLRCDEKHLGLDPRMQTPRLASTAVSKQTQGSQKSQTEQSFPDSGMTNNGPWDYSRNQLLR
jgi:hypothetical protein